MKFEREIEIFSTDLKKYAKNTIKIKNAFQNLLRNTSQMEGMRFKIAQQKEQFSTHEQQHNNQMIDYDAHIDNQSEIIPYGLWKSKYPIQTLEGLIDDIKKNEIKYILYNFIFENGKNFLLYQNNKIVLVGNLKDKFHTNELLIRFFNYNNIYEINFNFSLENFKEKICKILYEIQKEVNFLFLEDKNFNSEIKKTFEEFKKVNSSGSIKDIIIFIILHLVMMDIFKILLNINNFELSQNLIVKMINRIVLDFLPSKKNEIDLKINDFLRTIKNLIFTGTLSTSKKSKILIPIYYFILQVIDSTMKKEDF